MEWKAVWKRSRKTVWGGEREEAGLHRREVWGKGQFTGDVTVDERQS